MRRYIQIFEYRRKSFNVEFAINIFIKVFYLFYLFEIAFAIQTVTRQVGISSDLLFIT